MVPSFKAFCFLFKPLLKHFNEKIFPFHINTTGGLRFNLIVRKSMKIIERHQKYYHVKIVAFDRPYS